MLLTSDFRPHAVRKNDCEARTEKREEKEERYETGGSDSKERG